jgi:hypothetical protein
MWCSFVTTANCEVNSLCADIGAVNRAGLTDETVLCDVVHGKIQEYFDFHQFYSGCFFPIILTSNR